jgi:hypothetical protein
MGNSVDLFEVSFLYCSQRIVKIFMLSCYQAAKFLYEIMTCVSAVRLCLFSIGNTAAYLYYAVVHTSNSAYVIYDSRNPSHPRVSD